METGHYVEVILISAVFAAVALPLYYYRHRIVGWLRARSDGGGGRPHLSQGSDDHPTAP